MKIDKKALDEILKKVTEDAEIVSDTVAEEEWSTLHDLAVTAYAFQDMIQLSFKPEVRKDIIKRDEVSPIFREVSVILTALRKKYGVAALFYSAQWLSHEFLIALYEQQQEEWNEEEEDRVTFH